MAARTLETRNAPPSLAAEQSWWTRGASCIAGVDEVGRGAWAGPVVAAAVVLPPDPKIAALLSGVCDSKLLTPAQRERLAEVIRVHAVALAIGASPAQRVDDEGLLPATAAAMNEALRGLGRVPDHVLVDGLPMRGLSCPHTPLVRGDASCLSIAAASIVAKVARDRLMCDLDAPYPGYQFAAHKGYGTAAHRAALCDLGPSPVHRLSYFPVAAIAAQSWA
jgi:ribonuclease HII